MRPSFNDIPGALAALQNGKPVILVDDLDRENEGDLVLPAENVTAEMINFLAKYARGLICVAMTSENLDRLRVPMMYSEPNRKPFFGSPFTVSVEARTGVTTGISAADRARTARVLANPNSSSADVAMPGHMFPLRAHPDGLAARKGHTEASIDLMLLAGFHPSAVLCEIMNDDGTMARREELIQFGKKHNLIAISIDALISYRRISSQSGVRIESRSSELVRGDTARLPTRFGTFEVTAYEDGSGKEHLLLRKANYSASHRGKSNPSSLPVLVRIHSECLTGDVFHSLRCDCGEQLENALHAIAGEGEGVLLYLRQEGRGIGLGNKIRSYALQEQGLDTVEANICLGFEPDERNYTIAAAILRTEGISHIRLMTNNPDKVSSLESSGVTVVRRIPLLVPPRPENRQYLETKRAKMAHLLEFDS